MSVFELNKIISSMLNMGSERVGTTVVESAYSGTPLLRADLKL